MQIDPLSALAWHFESRTLSSIPKKRNKQLLWRLMFMCLGELPECLPAYRKCQKTKIMENLFPPVIIPIPSKLERVCI